MDTPIALALIVAVQAIATAYLNRRVKDVVKEVVQPIHQKVEKIAEKIGVEETE